MGENLLICFEVALPGPPDTQGLFPKTIFSDGSRDTFPTRACNWFPDRLRRILSLVYQAPGAL